MALDETISAIVQNPTIQIAIVGAIIGLALLKFTGRLGNKVKIISRPEIIKKKLIKTLEMNRAKTQILRQKGHIIGMMSNLGFYDVDKTKLYMFLFSPSLFGSIPKFWVKDVMIVSDEFLQEKDVEEQRMIAGMRVGTNLFKSWVLDENYFMDDYFMLKMNLADQKAMEFLKAKLALDETEIESSAYMAQLMRISSVDFSKAYEPKQADVEQERLNEQAEGK